MASKRIRRTTASPIAMNAAVVATREKQAASAEAVFRECLAAYHARLPDPLPADPDGLAHALLNNLTGPLWASYPETARKITRRFEATWKDHPNAAAKIASSVANSKKRSAGTNFQSLVGYALARYLVATGSAWYIQHPVPKEFQETLAITFTAGIPPRSGEGAEGAADRLASPGPECVGPERESAPVADTLSTIARVKPDVDMMLRNAHWNPSSGGREPIVLLSVKTSIIDRGGSAARWKMYFDLANDPCPHVREPACVYRRLGIQMENADRYDIHHGIVTANIYSMGNAELNHRAGGELENMQTQSNTYMFRLKLTTRDDETARTPRDWQQFEAVVEFLDRLSRERGLPSTWAT